MRVEYLNVLHSELNGKEWKNNIHGELLPTQICQFRDTIGDTYMNQRAAQCTPGERARASKRRNSSTALQHARNNGEWFSKVLGYRGFSWVRVRDKETFSRCVTGRPSDEGARFVRNVAPSPAYMFHKQPTSECGNTYCVGKPCISFSKQFHYLTDLPLAYSSIFSIKDS